ncbi:MAG TPA: hypothetical protein VEB43_03965 [Anaeromyxobacter sp.]|nr:hypothetical protein [Anaeromyxobacter sp.]
MLALLQFKGEEESRCLGNSVEDFRRDAPALFRAMAARNAGGTVQWEPAKAKVELVAGGLLAQVTVDGGPAIVIAWKEGKGRTSFKPYVAKIDGAFVIVR